MPHKTEAAELSDTRSEDAERLAAANTLVVGPDGLAGHNTDAPGFDRFLRRDAGFDPEGRTALIFGAGGAARACALALARGGLARLTVALRDAVRVRGLERSIEGLGTEVTVTGFDEAGSAAVDLVVNATPLGAHGEELPLPPLHADVLVVDLLYRPSLTPMQTAARDGRRRRVRRARTAVAPGRTVLRAVDRPAAAARGHVGGGARGTGLGPSVHPLPQGVPTGRRCSRGRRMDDYSGLAARVAAGVGGLRGCLILSRDGLVLGAYPSDDDSVAKPSWLRFAMLGEPERSFVEFGDQVWVYVHRGPYAAFAIADAGVRPGLVMDELEQALMTAEQARTKREGMRAPEGGAVTATPTPVGPRTTLHPTPAPSPPIVVPVAAEAAAGPPQPSARCRHVRRRHPPPRPPHPARSSHARRLRRSRRSRPRHQPEAPTGETPAPGTPKHEPPKLMTTPVTPDRGSDDEEESRRRGRPGDARSGVLGTAPGVRRRRGGALLTPYAGRTMTVPERQAPMSLGRVPPDLSAREFVGPLQDPMPSDEARP